MVKKPDLTYQVRQWRRARGLQQHMSGNEEKICGAFSEPQKCEKNKWCKPHCRVCNPSLKDVLQRLGWKKQKTDGKYCACRCSENVMNQKTHCVLEKVFNSGLRGARCWGILYQRGFLDWCNTALCCLLQPLHWTAFYCICWNYLMRLLGYCKEPIKDLDATNYLDRK